MRYYPVFLNLTKKRCVVIGGGKVAERKVLSLLKAGAAVTVASPELTPKLLELKGRGKIAHIARQYEEGDLKGAFLAVSAAGAAGLNDKIVSDGCLLNAADEPDKCDFIVPSTVTRGLLTVAVSTSGVSPALARTIGIHLRRKLGKDFASYLSFLKKFRKQALAGIKDKSKKAALLKMAGSGASVTAVSEGRLQELKADLVRRLEELSK